jgi:hypothetical protein
MLDFNSVIGFLFKQIKFKVIPPTAISLFLSIFPHIVGDDYLKWAGIQSIQILYSWPIGILLVVVTLGYFAIFYQKEWFGSKYKSKFSKYFKIFGFAFIGLTAVLIPYYLGIGNFFFGAMNLMNEGQNSENIMYLVAWTFGISFMLSDMFNSLDGKSGIIFKMSPINRSPVKIYSIIDYKLKKILQPIIN